MRDSEKKTRDWTHREAGWGAQVMEQPDLSVAWA